MSPDLKCNLNLWDRFAATVMSPASVCPVLACKAAAEMEIGKHRNTSMASATVQMLPPRTEEESASLVVKLQQVVVRGAPGYGSGRGLVGLKVERLFKDHQLGKKISWR